MTRDAVVALIAGTVGVALGLITGTAIKRKSPILEVTSSCGVSRAHGHAYFVGPGNGLPYIDQDALTYVTTVFGVHEQIGSRTRIRLDGNGVVEAVLYTEDERVPGQQGALYRLLQDPAPGPYPDVHGLLMDWVRLGLMVDGGWFRTWPEQRADGTWDTQSVPRPF
jgi:hypothetical protein